MCYPNPQMTGISYIQGGPNIQEGLAPPAYYYIMTPNKVILSTLP